MAKLDPVELLQRSDLPGLAKMLGPKSEVDVEEATRELIRLAGLTPTGKAKLRDGRTG